MKRYFTRRGQGYVSVLHRAIGFITMDAALRRLHSVMVFVLLVGSSTIGLAGTAYTAGQVRVPDLRCKGRLGISFGDGGKMETTHCYVMSSKCLVTCTIYCYSNGLGMASTISCGSTECLNQAVCMWNPVTKPYSQVTSCEYPQVFPCAKRWGDECAAVAVMRQACIRDRYQSPCADTDGVEVCCESH